LSFLGFFAINPCLLIAKILVFEEGKFMNFMNTCLIIG